MNPIGLSPPASLQAAEPRPAHTTAFLAHEGRPMLRAAVAEDDESVRRLLTLFLSRLGYAVEAVPGGRALVSLVRGARFDLIVSDVQMAGGDGLDAAEECRRVYDVPVVLASGDLAPCQEGRA